MEKVPEQRPVMHADLFRAAIEGNKAVLVQRLGLLDDEEQSHVKVQIDKASDSAPQQTATKSHSSQLELQSATTFGDTILHLLVANNRHNELALKVFHKDTTLLTAQNKKLETPLHYAAKFGNTEVIQGLIQHDLDLVKNVLRKTDENEETALHVAVKNGQKEVVRQLMEIDPKMAYEFNKEGISPWHLAIAQAYDPDDVVVDIMLDLDPTAAYTQFSDGTFLIHLATRMGNGDTVMQFIRNNWKCALLLDSCGRNLFHIAAAENKDYAIHMAFSASHKFSEYKEHFKKIINAKDCEGNTPLHIAAMRGNIDAALCIWRYVDETDMKLENNKGKTAFELSERHRIETSTPKQNSKIFNYIRRKGRVFSLEWFFFAEEPTPQEIAEKTQVIGLGSVLITTIAFAAALTFPGGYKADNDGTPVLGRRYMYRAFTIANALAFVEAFASVYLLILLNTVQSSWGDEYNYMESAALFFLSAATSMVKAFGIGSYVMLAPVNLPIAIIILILGMLFGSSTMISVFGQLPRKFSNWLSGEYYIPYEKCCANDTFASLIEAAVRLAMWAVRHGWPYLIIFGIAFLK